MFDDFYKKVVPDKVKFRRNVDMALLSDSEIITISLCGELLGIVSENAWFNPSTFFGYKVHVPTTERGAIKIFEILSATRAKRRSQITRKKLLALQLNNSSQNFPTETRQLIFKILRLIETFFTDN